MKNKKRGPIPKPPGNCVECNKFGLLKRQYCNTCYVRNLRNGCLKKIEKPLSLTTLTEQQKDVLIGSLLGDGCLFKHKETHNAYYAVQRSFKDKLFAEWQNNIFKDFITRFYDGETFDERTNKTYYWSKFITRRAEIWSDFYNQWYLNRIKIIPDNLQLSPLSLAIWFADDGYIRPVSSTWRMQLKLSTNGFSIENTEKLCALLCSRYNEYFGITIVKNKKQGIIYASDYACRKFITEIDSVYPDSMLRKAYWKKPEARFYENVPEKSRSGISVNLRKSLNGIRNETVI